jgi:hypothetical protein
VNDINRELMYFQVSPETELPFLINYDSKLGQWKCTSGIFPVKDEVVKAVGEALEKTLGMNRDYKVAS